MFRTLIAAMLLVTPAAAQQRQTTPVEAVRITGRIVEFTGGAGARTAAYLGDDAVMVIDAKMNEASVRAVLDAVSGLTGAPVRWLVNTHADGDHVTGNRWFGTDVGIIAHENCRREMLQPGRDGAPSPWTAPELEAFLPMLTYADSMTIHMGEDTAELHHFGTGHTTGDTVVYFPGEKTAIAADQAMLGRPQLIHAWKGGNSFGNVKNLEAMLAAIPAERFLLGHNEPATRADIRGAITAMKSRQSKVRALMGEGRGLDAIRAAFPENEAGLIEIIHAEIMEGRD